jgi:hypothetical protein
MRPPWCRLRLTNFKIPGSYLRNEASGEANMWSSDTRKFYVIGQGGHELAFQFNPSTMAISSLPGASPGKGLLLALLPGSTFSFTDPDLIYGTTPTAPLAITSYRFSTRVSTPVIDTTTGGTQPSLVPSRAVSDDDVSLSRDDNRYLEDVNVSGSSGCWPLLPYQRLRHLDVMHSAQPTRPLRN